MLFKLCKVTVLWKWLSTPLPLLGKWLTMLKMPSFYVATFTNIYDRKHAFDEQIIYFCHVLSSEIWMDDHNLQPRIVCHCGCVLPVLCATGTLAADGTVPHAPVVCGPGQWTTSQVSCDNIDCTSKEYLNFISHQAEVLNVWH